MSSSGKTERSAAGEHRKPDDRPAVALPVLRQPDPADSISDSSSPQQLLRWMFDHFSRSRILLTTSFGMEGCALIDMSAKLVGSSTDLTIAWIDTGFFFQESLSLADRMQKKYSSLKFERWTSPVSVEQQKQSYGDQLWKNNPNQCCHIRKVVPLKENIKGYDLWITGLRRSQTEKRMDLPVMQWDWRYLIQKFSPFASWERANVWDYVTENAVPFNPLHLRSYPSIGCTHCTQAVKGSAPDSDQRDGRWEGTEKTECGLHFSI